MFESEALVFTFIDFCSFGCLNFSAVEITNHAEQGSPARSLSGSIMRPAANFINYIYIYCKIYAIMWTVWYITYCNVFFQVPYANQHAITGVSFCHKQVGGARCRHWYGFINVWMDNRSTFVTAALQNTNKWLKARSAKGNLCNQSKVC